jgi:hypothetical protein
MSLRNNLNLTGGYMKKYLLLLTLGTLASCSQGIKQADSKPGYAIINTNEIHADASLASPEKAEKLALAAEQLMTPTSFMYADLVLDQALALDASNLRAKFYKAVVATPMSLKGIAARIKPLAARDLESLRRYNEAIANLPESGLKNFFLTDRAIFKMKRMSKLLWIQSTMPKTNFAFS